MSPVSAPPLKLMLAPPTTSVKLPVMFGDHPCNNLRTTKREHSISKQTRRARRKGLAEFATKAANGPA